MVKSQADNVCSLSQDQYRGQHRTYYVKRVYRHEHTQQDMLTPAHAGGFQTVSSFRYFNCKKNR